ncbi:MAG: GWxTD domain-containing protein [Candidatus Neomarinimicrobiota bacterium]|nr:GWxTD domain-containing protein [Candidatus Neomarinimicrobiota bacterium]
MRLSFTLFYLLVYGLLGQNITFLPTSFDMDVHQFREANGNTEAVVNLTVPKTLFNWRENGENYEFEGVIDVRVFINGNIAAQDVFHIRESVIDRPGPTERQVRMVEQSRFVLTKGSAVFSVAITDLASNEVHKVTKNVIIRTIDDSYLTTSDLLLCTFLKSERLMDENSINRNGYMITPNPSSVFRLEKPMFYAYSEVYGLQDDGGTYTVNYILFNRSGKEVFRRGPFVRIKHGESSVETMGFSMMGLLAGRYRLRLEVVDNQSDQNTFMDQEFIIVKELSTNFNNDFTMKLDAMENDEIQDFIDIVGYFMSESEFQTLMKENRGDQIMKLVDYFENHDPDRKTKENEFYNQINTRLALADKQFSNHNFSGRKTDRGRVLIRFGRPTNIETYPTNENRNSYEIWHYDDSDDGFIFVFINNDAVSMFEQIHSNHPDEFQNYGWKDMVVRESTNLINF